MEDDEYAGQLIEAVKRDRQQAFPVLVSAYQRRIYGFASRMCRNVEDAKDVLQETFLAAFRAIGDFRGEGKLSTWLFRIAANACRKMRRREASSSQTGSCRWRSSCRDPRSLRHR